MVAEGTCGAAFGSRLPPLPGKIVPPSTRCVSHDRSLPPADMSLSDPRSSSAGHALGDVELRDPLREPGPGRRRHRRPRRRRRGGNRRRQRFGDVLLVHPQHTRSSSMRTRRTPCGRTILSFSMPLYLAKSASLRMSTRMTSPLIVPFVDGENVRG